MKTRKIDALHKGDVFGRLTLLEDVISQPSAMPSVLCRCACGAIKRIQAWNIFYGHSHSCGCMQRENRNKGGWGKYPRRGQPGYELYCIWDRLKNIWRGRVCSEWMSSFDVFRQDVGEYKRGHRLMVRDTSTVITKDNVYWRPIALSKKTVVEFNRKRMSLGEVARLHGVSWGAVKRRMARGFTLDKAIKKRSRYRRVFPKAPTPPTENTSIIT